MDNTYNFSVLIPTYFKEKTENLELAIKSIIEQTLMPNEILIIEDGILGENLEQVINNYKKQYPSLINIIKFEENQGIGKVRSLGIEKAKYDIVAFMDSDDISRSDRFEKQIQFLKENPDIDMVGSWVTEFEDKPDNIYSKRILPTKYEDVYTFAKFRMPVNNNTIMFKRKPVIEIGSYQIATGFEDYEVCGKLLNKGYKIANIPDFLVNMRAGQELMNRRKGLQYFVKYEYACMKSFYDIGFINIWEFLRNIVLKFPLRIMPDCMRNIIYKRFLRS